MSKRTVYYFTRFDVVSGRTVRLGPARLEAITMARGEAILDTEHEIDESDLDGDGYAGWKRQTKPPDSK